MSAHKYCADCGDRKPLNDRETPLCDWCEWHGWSRNGGTALHIGRLPGRKSVCLYTHEGTVIRTHAFFKNVDDARRVMKVIDALASADGEEKGR